MNLVIKKQIEKQIEVRKDSIEILDNYKYGVDEEQIQVFFQGINLGQGTTSVFTF